MALPKSSDYIKQDSCDLPNIGEYQSILEKLICPLTGKLFKNPIISSQDNTVYEKSEFIESIKYLDEKPIYYDVYTIKMIVNEFIDKYPELKKFQFID
jgi:hypothetical protein